MPLESEIYLKEFLHSYNKLRMLDLSIYACRTWDYTFSLFHTILLGIPTLSDLTFGVAVKEDLAQEEMERVANLTVVPATATLRSLKLNLKVDSDLSYHQKFYFNSFASILGSTLNHISKLHFSWEQTRTEDSDDLGSITEDEDSSGGEEIEASEIASWGIPAYISSLSRLQWTMPVLRVLSLRWWDLSNRIDLRLLRPETLAGITDLYIEFPDYTDFEDLNQVRRYPKGPVPVLSLSHCFESDMIWRP